MTAINTGSLRTRAEVRSPSGLRAEFTSTGTLRRFEVDGLSLLQYPADELEPGPCNLYLRVRAAMTRVCPLLGTGADIGWTEHGPVVRGRFENLEYRVFFRLAAATPAWYWHIDLVNQGSEAQVVDLVYAHDIALAPYAAVRRNEYYVCHYLDVTPVDTAEVGTALAVRQNMPGQAGAWVLLGSLGHAVHWGTDALQLESSLPHSPVLQAGDLPSARLQHEHALALLQDQATRVPPGQRIEAGFFGIYQADHRAATSPADAAIVATVLDQPESKPSASGHAGHADRIEPSLFSPAALLSCRDLNEQEIQELAGPIARHAERADGRLLSYFTEDGMHVVLAAKERAVLRPHGHIFRTGSRLVPEQNSLTSTAWMAGVFHSQVTQGHAAINGILSTRRGYVRPRRARGLRVFVAAPEPASDWALLDQPSAWAVSEDRCVWWYKHSGGLIEVIAAAPADTHELSLRIRVREGDPSALLICANLALGDDDGQERGLPPTAADQTGITVMPPPDSELRLRFPSGSIRLAWSAGAVEGVGRDEVLFADGRSRQLPWVTLRTAPIADVRLTLTASLTNADDRHAPVETSFEPLWPRLRQTIRLSLPRGSTRYEELEALDDILPWFAHDALIHYLAPRGLEQYNGGAWGTRDVCQGPVGLLLTLDQLPALRDLLIRVFRAQNVGGDWPQWFEFLPGAPESDRPKPHGDVIFWPLLALGEYLTASADATILEHAIPFADSNGAAAPSVLDHVRRALVRIDHDTIAGTALPAYGLGDWNDSMRPADSHLAARLCSTWTVTLQVESLRTLANALRAISGSTPSHSSLDEVAATAERMVKASAAAMRSLLLRDGVLAGYGLFAEDGSAELLVHPADRRTNLHYGILQISSAIASDLLDAEEAEAHLRIIDQHLMGPDGARLFDRPARYRGGPMEVFERAEAAAFFGREVGLMYMHAHLRYAEALAHFGDASRFFKALTLANPIGLSERVPAARPRQSTCYFTSSDAAFADRYQAAEQYDRVIRDQVPLEAGWRVYSSGPGIFLRLILERLLGLRRRPDRLEVDPVLDPALDGLGATLPLAGRPVEVRYRIGGSGLGPVAVSLNGVALRMRPLSNPYRPPGVAISMTEIRECLRPDGNLFEVQLG